MGRDLPLTGRSLLPNPGVARHSAAMEARAWQRLARAHLLGKLPGLVQSGPLLHLPDTTWLLRGVAMVASAPAESFRLWVFVQPLYVPAERLVFRYGREVTRVGDRGASLWPARTDPALAAEIITSIRAQGLPLLLGVSGPADLIALIREQTEANTDLGHLEATAGAAILAGDAARVRLVGQQLRELPPGLLREGKAQRIRNLLACYEQNAAGARSLLRFRRNETARALHLR